MTTNWSTVRYGDIDVCWTPELDGGGMTFGQDYVPIVAELFGHVGRLCEVCAGPGFIGFALLAHGLCDSLVLTDINPQAVAAVEETIRRNDLADKVTVYLSDGLQDWPGDERCDLFVSNPPHFSSPVGVVSNTLLTDDLDWRLHREFFGSVGRFLAPGGSVLWQKNSHGGTPEEFLPMIEAGGLRHLDTLWYTGAGNSTLFYLWAKLISPELVGDAGRSDPVVLDLGHSVPDPLELPADASYVFTLRNRTGRPVATRFTTSDGDEPLGRRARDILPMSLAVDGELTLPRMALRPGDYHVVDELSEAVLCSVRVMKN